MLVTRKNLKARKGKQRWRRNIDINQIPTQDVQFKAPEQGTLDYVIDDKPQSIYENKDRFKKQHEEPKSRTEKKRIRSQPIYKFNTLLEIQDMVKQQEKQEERKTQDLWEDDVCTQKKRNTHYKSTAEQPIFIVQPKGGQSYNPSIKKYNQLVEKVVQEEIDERNKKNENNEEDQIRRLKEQEERKKEKLRRRYKERSQGKQAILEEEEKKKNHQFNLIKKFKKEFAEKKEISKKRQEEKELKRKLESEGYQQGRLIKNKKLGRKIVKKTKDDFMLQDQLKGKLRYMSYDDNIVQNQFESYARRGLVEPKTSSNKLSGRKLPKYKEKVRFEENMWSERQNEQEKLEKQKLKMI